MPEPTSRAYTFVEYMQIARLLCKSESGWQKIMIDPGTCDVNVELIAVKHVSNRALRILSRTEWCNFCLRQWPKPDAFVGPLSCAGASWPLLVATWRNCCWVDRHSSEHRAIDSTAVSSQRSKGSYMGLSIRFRFNNMLSTLFCPC